jgi:flagellar hook-basal body complex protein FliE
MATNGIDKLSLLNTNQTSKVDANANTKTDFSDVLKKSIDELNQTQKNAEKAMNEIATGEVKNLHQAAIAIDKAEINMKLMLEIRNKAISAYKEILRTQV